MAYKQFLVVEDDSLIRRFIASELERYGRVFEAEDEERAKEIIQNIKLDMAFIDLNLTNTQEFEGLRLVEKCKDAGIPSLVLTGHESQSIIDEAYSRGAHSFYSKGDIAGENGLNHSILNFIKSLGEDHFNEFFTDEFITENEALRSKIRFLKDQVLEEDQKVLITGPSGVGKTKIAQLIHKLTESQGPFIEKNLSELSENLFESEMFGHVKGAFTGAVHDKIGLLEQADGGTLFLDEIGSLNTRMQQKILKVIEEGRFRPLGSLEERKVNFRLVTATCEDLADRINEGLFRIDFYFRIKGIEIDIPALKNRREDILPLIKHFTSKSSKKISLTKEAENCLWSYDWPGNIRELSALIKELRSYSKGLVEKENLPSYIQNNSDPFVKETQKEDKILNPKMKNFIELNGLPALIQEIEKEGMIFGKSKFGDKINSVARFLKISKSVFYRINEALNE